MVWSVDSRCGRKFVTERTIGGISEPVFSPMLFVKLIEFLVDLSLRVSDLIVDPVFFIRPEVPRSIELLSISRKEI